jgi:hypothetical protein
MPEMVRVWPNCHLHPTITGGAYHLSYHPQCSPSKNQVFPTHFSWSISPIRFTPETILSSGIYTDIWDHWMERFRLTAWDLDPARLTKRASVRRAAGSKIIWSSAARDVHICLVYLIGIPSGNQRWLAGKSTIVLCAQL